MIQKLFSKRPILVGGLGLTAAVGLVGGVGDVLSESASLLTMLAAGAGVWWWRRQRSPEVPASPRPIMPAQRETVEAALAALQPSLSALRQEAVAAGMADSDLAITSLEQRQQGLVQALDRQTLKVASASNPRCGKTSLLTQLAARFTQADAEPSLSFSEVPLMPDQAQATVLEALSHDYDGVLYLITEDLTESALTDITQLTEAGQRVVLVLNKQDTYLPDVRAVLLDTLRQRVQSLSWPVVVVSIATAPKPMKVRTHTADGKVQERLEPQPEVVEPLIDLLQTWRSDDLADLVTQTVMRQTHRLRQDIQVALNQIRHTQAKPVVEQLQWAAAAATFANPVPSLDLLAATAITGQLIMDLGRVYHQPVALDQAQAIAGELAAVVAKLGLVELSTQLLATALKSHVATYVVGGSVQALSAAYLTHLSGESLMAYFEARALSGQADKTLSASDIGDKIKAILPMTQRTEFLQTLITQGLKKLTPSTAPALPTGTTEMVTLPTAAVPVSLEIADQTISEIADGQSIEIPQGIPPVSMPVQETPESSR